MFKGFGCVFLFVFPKKYCKYIFFVADLESISNVVLKYKILN